MCERRGGFMSHRWVHSDFEPSSLAIHYNSNGRTASLLQTLVDIGQCRVAAFGVKNGLLKEASGRGSLLFRNRLASPAHFRGKSFSVRIE